MKRVLAPVCIAAMVIDIKDSNGRVGYDSKVPLIAQTAAVRMNGPSISKPAGK